MEYKDLIAACIRASMEEHSYYMSNEAINAAAENVYDSLSDVFDDAFDYRRQYEK